VANRGYGDGVILEAVGEHRTLFEQALEAANELRAEALEVFVFS
jgi:hypothetical protein